MASAFDLSQIDHLLSTTRAVRKRLDLARPVPREMILECIQLATQAPTGANSQRWRWLVVDDPEVRAALAGLYQRAYGPYIERQQEAVAEVRPGDSTTARVIDSSTYLAEHLAEVPVHVIPCALDRPPTAAADAAGWFGSILPAVWSFQLALRSRGIGSAWTTLHLSYEADAAALLGIPDTVTQVALLPVAYFTGDDFKPARRRPAGEVTYWNGWRQRGVDDEQ